MNCDNTIHVQFAYGRRCQLNERKRWEFVLFGSTLRLGGDHQFITAFWIYAVINSITINCQECHWSYIT
jgi:hypothetical protein